MKILYIILLGFFHFPFIFLFAQNNGLVTAQTSDELYRKEKMERELERIQREKDHVLSLEGQWLLAELKMDTIFIASLIDSSYMGISESGIYSKQDELASIITTREDRRKNNITIDT